MNTVASDVSARNANPAASGDNVGTSPIERGAAPGSFKPAHHAPPVGSMKPKIEVNNLNFFYNKFHALKNINLRIPEHKVTAFIGPS